MMNSKPAKKLSPIVSDEQKLEVSLKNGRAVMRLSTWTDDLGWCLQKTLDFDIEMLDDLHRSIAAARYKVNSEKNIGPANNGKIIDFPRT